MERFRRREMPRQKIEKVDGGETQKELEEFLEEIDLKALKSIFEEIYRKSGLDTAKLNFPAYIPGGIRELRRSWLSSSRYMEETAGLYDNLTNRVSINLENHREDLKDSVYTKFGFLHTLIHELTHAASDWKTGLEGIVGSGYSWGGSFRSINEAVTESIAQEIAIEYIRRTAFAGGLDAWRHVSAESVQSYGHLTAKGDPKTEMHKILLDKSFGVYSTERRILKKIIGTISESTGVPEETVWQGFVRGYFENDEKLADPELRTLLEEVFHPGFVRKLRAVEGNEDSIKELFDKQFTGTLRGHLVRGFKRWTEQSVKARK